MSSIPEDIIALPAMVSMKHVSVVWPSRPEIHLLYMKDNIRSSYSLLVSSFTCMVDKP